MPYGDVFTRINREYYQLTGAERKIADHIMLQRQNCQYMSISELAEVAEVAEATVSRFCRRLGYKGYSAFKLAVAGAASGAKPVNPLYGEIAAEDDVSEMCRKLCAADVEAITQTMNMLDPASVSAAADLLVGAERVLCMGLGGSMVLAQEAAHLFSTALPNFYPVDDSHFQAIRAALLTPGDAVMYFSYSGSTRDLQDALEVARARRVPMILVSRFPKSPGGQQADVVLQCGVNESPLQPGSVSARMAQLLILDLLFQQLCSRNQDQVDEYRARIAEAAAKKHL